MKIDSKSKVCVEILAAVITSIVFIANTGFTKVLAQTPLIPSTQEQLVAMQLQEKCQI